MAEVANFSNDSSDPFRKWLAESGGKLTDQQIADLMAKLIDGRISTFQFSSLLKTAPSLSAPIVEFLRSVPQLAQEISKSQTDALTANKHIYDEHLAALKTLIAQAQSDNARLKLAEEITAAARMAHEGIAAINKNATKARNQLGKGVKYALGGAVSIAVAVFSLTR